MIARALWCWLPALLAAALLLGAAPAQDEPEREPEREPDREQPRLTVGIVPADLIVDGRLDEAVWGSQPSIDGLITIDPVEGGTPAGRTRITVLASPRELVIGVRCEDPDPAGIVSYSVARDSVLEDEDHVLVVLGTFLDGRTGYVFAVNPAGSRFDALVSERGEEMNKDWDGIWEARTTRTSFGWSAEIRIPIQTLAFEQGLRQWHLNVQRRVQRLLETSRWASPMRDYEITQTSRAGLLQGLPPFELDHGITATPSGVFSVGRETADDNNDVDFETSFDATWRITPQLLATLTVNTDFAETEVDLRRTNLTRFPLFFPEKRKFFLEGADAFDFGAGLGLDVVPFFSRRIGLVDGREVPLLVGGKTVGRIGDTSVGALVTKNGAKTGVAPESVTGVVRVRQDVLEESTIGLISTVGDPLGRDGSWMAGVDTTYQLSDLFGDQNFLAAAWGLTMDREGLGGNSRTAYGLGLAYPNDLVNAAFTHMRIGEDFDPSLGFVPRSGVKLYRLEAAYVPRPDIDWLRETAYETRLELYTDLHDSWESYEAFTAPINWNFESGDAFEFNVIPTGERLLEDFEIADDVEIPPGDYRWVRYRVKVEAARKRAISGEVSWSFGEFYDGDLDTIEGELQLVPTSWLTLQLAAEHNKARLPQGSFIEDLYSAKALLNLSPDLTLSSLLQYDTDSRVLGNSSRFRWTITPATELFLGLDFNWERPESESRLRAGGYETSLKLQHSFRF